MIIYESIEKLKSLFIVEVIAMGAVMQRGQMTRTAVVRKLIQTPEPRSKYVNSHMKHTKYNDRGIVP